MSKYTMAQIVALTDIKAHTLRKWETRYSFLKPERTGTNIRYYSDSQLKKLLNISVLTRNGYRISKINTMSSEEISEIITTKLIDSNQKDEINALIISMIDFEEESFDKLLKAQIIKNGLLKTTTEIIYPFLHQVGILWGVNKVMPAQEHFISNIIRKRFLSIIDSLPAPKKNAPQILMFLPENEYHEMGLLLAYYIARELGWKVYYLGQNVPIINIQQVISEVRPNAMLTMFVAPIKNIISEILDVILKKTEIPLFVSGNPKNFENIVNKRQVIQLLNPNDFIDQLKAVS